MTWPHVAWVLWTLSVTLVFGRIGAYNLGNYRPVSNDEMELMAVAYKLASQGVLGSDLYAGFFGADQHFLITLPLQHLADAASFRLFGVGVAQMRWVSLVAGVSLVWVVSWLAYRWYGLGTAVIADLLLVAWPSNLTSAPNGLPLLGVTRAARYDVLAVAFAWLAIALLDALLRRPPETSGPGNHRASTQAFGVGVCCGLAALAQFMGAFVVPLIVLNWFLARGRRGLTEPLLSWIVAGAGIVVLPWITFVAVYHADWTAQLTVFGDRLDVLSPSFYATNLLGEAARYQNLLRVGPSEDPSAPDSPVSQFIMALAVWPAAAYVALRSRRTHAVGDRLLWSSLVIFSGLLLLVDQTKTPLYAIILLPSICLAIAILSTSLWRRARATPPLESHSHSGGIPMSTTLSSGKNPRAWSRAPRYARSTTALVSLLPRVVLICVGLVIAKDGIAAYQVYLAQAAQVSQYLGVGLQLEEALPKGAHVLGPERWWWALHDHPYWSLRSVWWQWSSEAGPNQSPQFATWVASTQADAIIVNDNIRDDIQAFPTALQQQFWAFVSTCTTPVLDLTDASYLRIEVDRITRPPPDREICGGRR